MTVTFCLSGNVVLKAGANVSTALTDANYTTFINEAESYINNVCKIEGVDLTASYSTLSANTKKILEDAASSHAAIAAINYDMSGYTSTSEAQTMINVNWAKLQDCLALLKEKKTTDYLRSI